METGKTPGKRNPLDDPTEMTHIGPATAAIIEDAPFDALDIMERTVSYSTLLDSGVNPGVAAKLRKEYSLVWSFEWNAGADLVRRAARVGELDPEHRDWIAASEATRVDTAQPPPARDRAWSEREAWLDPVDELVRPCERCGGRLSSYQLNRSRAIQCMDCGFVGIPTNG